MGRSRSFSLKRRRTGKAAYPAQGVKQPPPGIGWRLFEVYASTLTSHVARYTQSEHLIGLQRMAARSPNLLNAALRFRSAPSASVRLPAPFRYGSSPSSSCAPSLRPNGNQPHRISALFFGLSQRPFLHPAIGSSFRGWAMAAIKAGCVGSEPVSTLREVSHATLWACKSRPP